MCASAPAVVDNTPALPSLHTENPQSVCSTVSSTGSLAAAADRRECAADVSSSLVLGASVECATSDSQPQPTIMLGKYCSCVELLNALHLLVQR